MHQASSRRIDGYFHVFSKGQSSRNLYETTDDFVRGMNAIPVYLRRYRLRLFAAKLNDSHEHFVLQGAYGDCLDFIGQHIKHAAMVRSYRRRRERMARIFRVEAGVLKKRMGL